MKPFLTFVLGAIVGASLLWFGFRKEVVILNNRAVVVDRFSGKAQRVFVSNMEAEQLERDEAKRIEALYENGTSASEEAQWRELDVSEIKKLEFQWSQNGSNIKAEFHNPFEQEVKVERVRVQIPAQNAHAAIDREFQTDHSICPPLADCVDLLQSIRIPFENFLGPRPSDGSERPKVGAITPIRVLIRK